MLTATSGPPPDGWAGEGYNGVHVFAPDGTLIGKIHLPEACANLCFGGAKRNRLFMAASQSSTRFTSRPKAPRCLDNANAWL
jgi:sugar lactone lactonase YvrE